MKRRLLRPVFWVLPLLLLYAAPLPVHADEWPVPVGPSREPEPYKFQAEALKQAPPAFLDDAPACMVYYGVTHLVQADGTTETIIHEIMRLNGRKGVENLGEYHGISFDPAYQKLTLNRARVLKKNGKVVPVEPRQVKLRDTSTDYFSYDQDKELVISFPGLEVGDLYEVKWTTVGRHPENQGHFFRQYLFGSANYPILRDSFTVRLPKALTLKYKTVNGQVTPLVREDDGHRTYRWTVTNHPGLPRDEDLPPRDELRLQLVCSTFASWDEVGRWKQKLRKDCWECTPAVKQVVQQVTAGLDSAEEKAAALTYWVRKKIRYVSVVSPTHRYTPSLPGVVAANLYGDCKDQAQLLAVMLRQAGIDKVYLATLGLRGDGQVQPEVPSPWGTHAIVMARINGHEHWIDTTATFAAWDVLPHGGRDRVAYVTDENGKLEVLRTPKATAAENRILQTTWVHVQPDGSTVCRRQATYHGLAAQQARNKWVDTPQGECRRLVTTQLQDSYSGSRLLGLSLQPANLHDLGQPVRAVMEFEVPQHFSGGDTREASFSDGNVWGRLLAYHADYERAWDLDLWAPFESAHRFVVQLPPGWRFDTDASEKVVTSRWGSFVARVERDGDSDRRVEVVFYTRLEDARVRVKDFAEFRKFQQEVQDGWRVWLSSVPSRNLADALELEAALAAAPDNLATVRTLAALYRHHGRSADLQRVLKTALVHRPLDPSLWEMAVQATATLADEEATYRQMVKRFPQQTKYVLALASTCMKRGHYHEARKILDPLTRSESDSVRGQAHYHLARVAFRQKEFGQALAAWRQAAADDAAAVQSAAALELLGKIHEGLGQRDKAMDSYRRALQVQASARNVQAALIRLELAAGHGEQALQGLRQYAVLVKGNVAGLNQAATFYLQLGRINEALDLALAARDVKFHADTQKLLGLIYLRKDEPGKAIFHLDRATPDAEVVAALIRANLALGDLERAVEHARTAADLDHPTAELALLAARCAELGLRRAKLVASANVPPEKQEAWANLVDRFLCAEFAHQGGRPAAEVNKLLAPGFAPDLPYGPAFGLRALLALEKGHIKSALNDAETCIKLSPLEARGWYVRGRIRAEVGHADALKDLQRAAELSGRKDGHILHWLATAQFDAGRHQEALTTQQEALQRLPGTPELLEQLQRFQKNAER